MTEAERVAWVTARLMGRTIVENISNERGYAAMRITLENGTVRIDTPNQILSGANGWSMSAEAKKLGTASMSTMTASYDVASGSNVFEHSSKKDER